MRLSCVPNVYRPSTEELMDVQLINTKTPSEMTGVKPGTLRS